MSEKVRHFTSSAYVVHQEKVLLHWHKKVKEYLPPGGHIEPNEDPVGAALREVNEETGLEVDLYIGPTAHHFRFVYPKSIHSPEIILIEDIDDPSEGFHQHLDFIYICTPRSLENLKDGWAWFSKADLKDGLTSESGKLWMPPADVVELGCYAIDFVGGVR